MSRVLVFILLVLTLPTAAQMVTVSDSFRIVEVDRDKRRLGVAALDADPNVRQNWVNLGDSTKVTLSGDKPVTLSTALSSLKKGDVIRVHGGRKWSGKIKAKTIVLTSASEARASGSPATAAASQVTADQVTNVGESVANSIPYSQTQWKGKVQEVTDESVVLETAKGFVILPRGLDYNGDLTVGQDVSTLIPSGSGELVSASAETLTLRGAQGLYQLPVTSVTDPLVEVPVLTTKGTSVSLPLETALKLQSMNDGSVLAQEFHGSQAAELAEGAGVVLNSTPDFAVVAMPGGGVVRLPASTALKVGQPVSFGQGYLNELSSWQTGGGKMKGKGGKGKGGKGKKGKKGKVKF
jgi:hypothetical protein